MEKKSSGLRPVEANSTEGQGSRRAVAPSDDDDDDDDSTKSIGELFLFFLKRIFIPDLRLLNSSVHLSFRSCAFKNTGDMASNDKDY
jgi:hypothetical protein